MSRTSTCRIGVMAALILLIAGPPAGAAADPVSEKQEEAAALAEKLGDQARRIVSLDAEFRRAERDLSEAENAVAQAVAEIAATTRQQEEIRRQLVVIAQDAYMSGGSVTVLRYLVTTDQTAPVVRRAYLRLVTGQDRRLIGALRANREDLEGLRDRLDIARRRAGAQADAIGADRRALDQAMRVQQSNLAAVNDELSALVAAEQSRRAAVAAEQSRRAAAPPPPPAPAPRSPSPAVAPAVAPVPAAAPNSSMPNADAWACIRQLESGNNYASPSGGAYQFLDSTWQGLGYSGTASDAPPAVQDEAAVKLHAQSGWRPWTVAPMCGLI